MNVKNRKNTKTILLTLLLLVLLVLVIVYGDLVICTCVAIVLGEAVAMAC